MEKKPTLAELFQVNDLIQPRSVVNEGESDLDNKTPYQISSDIKQIVDVMNDNASSGDLIGICKCIDAIELRIFYLQGIIIQIEQLLRDSKQHD